jgi:NAD(P)-dependent dehydrogenase (short-subunit alcohol dehydrogenase family)
MDYRNLFGLTGRVALVTGGAGILGKHFCSALAAFGATVVVCDRDQSDSDKVAAQVRADYGHDALGVACDVGDPRSVDEMVATIRDRFGVCDILLNNAATKTADLEAFFAPAEDYGLEAWREVMRVNLDGMFLVARAVGKSMLERGKGGSIIQTSSIYGVMGADQRIYEGSEYMGVRISNPVVYSASKAGVVGLTHHLATAWAAQGVRVNTLIPGGIRSGQNDRFVANYSARVPMGRMGQPNELVGALIYLASDASSYVTGQCMLVDGGLSAW